PPGRADARRWTTTSYVRSRTTGESSPPDRIAMKRRAFLATPLLLLGSPARCADDFPEVVTGRPLRFPQDYGAHPEFRNDWGSVPAGLPVAGGDASGFQVTFFRNRPAAADATRGGLAP